MARPAQLDDVSCTRSTPPQRLHSQKVAAMSFWVVLIIFAILMLSPVLYGVGVGVRALCRLVVSGIRRSRDALTASLSRSSRR